MRAATLAFGLVVLVGSTRTLHAGAPQEARAPQEGRTTPDWPVSWIAAWSHPTAELRPLQIVHGVAPDQATAAAMTGLKELGLGGIVCNVDFADYLVSESKWATLVKAVDACCEAGLRVWLYDEKGYPSGSAGGLVLKENPDFEALALAYDPSLGEPFVFRKAYEHTHASNNFCAARRYPNLIDDTAVRTFIARTHGAYWQHLEKHFGTTIQAIFTDEPSLMAVNIGQLPEQVRKNVPVDDPLDANLKPLPCVPWVHDLPEQYRQRYGQDIMSVRRSLFAGDADADRQVRRRFWALIADLIAERYFGQIEDWCRQHAIASSGHTLWEENPLHHVPLEGNALKVLRRMHVPGLDMLSSDPQTVVYAGWMSALLPASAALAEGRRRAMTEVSDFVQTQAGKGPASLPEMQATAAWQAALGVTEFTLYYDRTSRPAADYRAYTDYVGRLNALLRDARFHPDVVLYYPIYDLWAEYLPVAGPLKLESQGPRAQQLVNSFVRMGGQLAMTQIPFTLADHEMLAAAEVREGKLWIGQHGFGALVLPAGAELPEPASRVVARFKSGGGPVIIDEVFGEPTLSIRAGGYTARHRLQPPCDRIILGRFAREGRDILLLVNVGTQAYAGSLAVEKPGAWWLADPADGRVEQVLAREPGGIAVSLRQYAAILLVGPIAHPGGTMPG